MASVKTRVFCGGWLDPKSSILVCWNRLIFPPFQRTGPSFNISSPCPSHNGATFAPRPFLSRPSAAAVQAARCQYNLDAFRLDDSSCESAASSPAEKRKHGEIGISRRPFLRSRLSFDSVSPLKDSLYIHTHIRMYM